MEVSIQHKETNKPQLPLLPKHQSLTDGDIITPENQATNPIWSGPDPGLSLFGPCGSSSSGWSTPIGSEPGSTETESEEDEFIAELTRQMADYMLEEEEEEEDENSIRQNHHKPSPPITGLQSSQHLTDNQIKSIQFYQMKNRELLKKQGSVGRGRKGKMDQSTQKSEPKHHQKMEKNRGGRGGRLNPRPVGSGMRAVFLGESVLKSGCPGTGVFLPRGIGNPTETTTRSKPRCSTVLIPAKVIQALQLHYNQMNVQLRSKGNPSLQAKWMNDDDDDRSCLGERGAELQKQHLQPDHDQSQQQKKKMTMMMDHHHMGLPQEWTY